MSIDVTRNYESYKRAESYQDGGSEKITVMEGVFGLPIQLVIVDYRGSLNVESSFIISIKHPVNSTH